MSSDIHPVVARFVAEMLKPPPKPEPPPPLFKACWKDLAAVAREEAERKAAEELENRYGMTPIPHPEF